MCGWVGPGCGLVNGTLPVGASTINIFTILCVGHKSAIKSLYISDTEHLSFSASKDKTVKIWSLHNQGDGSAQCSPKLTYTGHSKSVWRAVPINSLQQLVSCDGTLHVS